MPTTADRLRAQYRESLGRDASDDEIARWTSGQYGGGGVDQWLGQIRSSHEAQQRGRATAPPPQAAPPPPARQPLAYQATPGAAYGSSPPATSYGSNQPSAAQPRTTQPRTTQYTTGQSPRVTTQSQYNRQEPEATAGTGGDSWQQFLNDHRNSGAEEIIRDAYRQFTGRDPDPDGLRAHLNNPGGPEGAARAIFESEEAQAHSANTATTPPPAGTPPLATNPNAPPAVNPATVTPQVFQGFVPVHAMEGFNFEREQNTGRSAKDAFAWLAQQAPPPPTGDKAALAQWFNTHIRPGMDALGHHIDSVEGDTFRFSNWQGTYDVDYARGAGAAGAALAWQVDDKTARAGTGQYTPPPPPQQQGQAQAPPPQQGATPRPPANGDVPPPPDDHDTTNSTFRQSRTGQPLVAPADYQAPTSRTLGSASPMSAAVSYRRRPYRRFASGDQRGQSPPQPSI